MVWVCSKTASLQANQRLATYPCATHPGRGARARSRPGGAMQKLIQAGMFASVGWLAACATGVVQTGDDTFLHPDGGKGQDGSFNGKDSSGNPDSGGDPPDTSVDNCSKSPPSNVCGVDPQCGCASDTCEVDQVKLDGSSACVTAGSTGVGKPCTATASQCGTGLTCIWGVCRPYCGSIGDGKKCNKPGTGVCRQLTNNSMAAIQNLVVCSTDCVLNDPNSCGGKSGCIYDGTNMVTDCYPVGTSQTCSKTNSNCAPGLICFTTNSVNYMCGKWCKVGGNDCGGKVCGSFNPKTIVNNIEYACVINDSVTHG